jgi:hypothetical protein
MAGTAREEAERLVATVLAMAAQSGLGGAPGDRDHEDDTLSGTARRLGEGLSAVGDTVAGFVGHLTGASGGGSGADSWTVGTRTIGGRAMVGWATGSAECCVCPLCRVIASLRDPSPETAERLATGAGDIATGVASLLRAFSAMTSNTRPRKPASPGRPAPDPDTAWSAATRTPPPAATRTPPPADTRTPPTAATRVPPTAAGTQDAGGRPDEPDEPPIPDGDGSPWSAATRASDREVRAADHAARAARRARRQAEQEARRIEQEARRIEQEARRIEQKMHRAAQEAHRGEQEAHRGAEDAAADRGEEEARRPAADPRTIHGFESPGAERDRPAAKADVWAAATADSADRGVAAGRNVDHDDPGAPAPAGQADFGSPPAEAAGSPETAADGDARAGDGM